MGWERTKDTPEILRMENISLVTPRGKSYIIQSKPRYDYCNSTIIISKLNFFQKVSPFKNRIAHLSSDKKCCLVNSLNDTVVNECKFCIGPGEGGS